MAQVIDGLVQLYRNRYYLLLFKPTGELYGKKGVRLISPDYLFETEAGAKRGLTLFLPYAQYAWHSLHNVPGAMDKSNWEVIPVDVEIKV